MYLVPVFSSHTGWPLSKFPQKQCNHLIAVGLLTKKNPTLWKLSHSGGAELHRLIMGLTLNYMTLTKWSDSWDSTLQPPHPPKKGKKKKKRFMIGMVNKRCVELHRVGDENWPQAALWEWIAEDASIFYVNEWQVRTQTPIDPQHTECSHWVVNMHKHSELNRWPDRSGLLCMNAPQISLCCISQPTVLWLN